MRTAQVAASSFVADRVDDRGLLTLANGITAVIAAALIAATVASMRSAMTYDEGVYLSLAREITSSGLPWRLDWHDLRHMALFETSPPLVMYVAAATQLLWPGHEMPSRIVQIGLFVLPTYLLVWWITRRRFGPWAAAAALLALLSSREYLLAAGHVMLDVPLGLLALIVLFCFDRALASSNSPESQRRWALLAAAALFLATWTKYQAVCICAAIALYCAYLLVSLPSNERAIVRLKMPIAAAVAAGALALAVLFTYFLGFGGTSNLTPALAFNAERLSIGSETWRSIAVDALGVATHTVWTIGPVLLASALAAWLVQPGDRGLVALLTAYVLATIAFSIIFFRLPGSGSYYLHSAVPAVAVLTGGAAGALMDAVQPAGRGAAVLLVVAAVQLVAAPPSLFRAPSSPSVRQAADPITHHRDADADVLAVRPGVPLVP
jgi:dolichyl-phosphate-mannose-protein mannosyltransferase